MSNGLQLGSESYRPNSFVYIEGQKDSNTFFIIRSGKVQILKEFTVVESDTSPILNPGDFFGVISCMSAHPRIESAKTMSETSLIVIKKDQFGDLVLKSSPIALKIIRSFSKKLRHYNSEIARLTLKESGAEDPKKLFSIGEYYQTQNQVQKAAHAFQKFIQYCPEDEKVEQAKQILQQMGQPLQAPPPTGSGMQRQYPNDTMIFSEHEPGEDLFIIQQGKVNITKIINNKEVMLAVLQAGEIFGEMALLEDKPRGASAIANGDCVLLQVNKSNFDTMVVQQPQIATKLIQGFSERIWTDYKHLENLMLKDPMGRIYDMLLTQVLSKKIPIEHRSEHTYDFGPQELIKMLGFSEADGNMYIRKLMENKKIQEVNGKIHTTDLEEIEKQVSYYKKIQEMERKREQAARKMG